MRATPGRSAALILGLLLTYGIAGHAQETGASWLDAPEIPAWNTADASIPAAPEAQDSINLRCRDLARPPQTEEDRQVRDRGWDLVGAFQSGWDVVVIHGTAGYDGMCRPTQFQGFVFVRGRFAGTLAPAPMDSRTDGALSRVTLKGPKALTAEYLRYEESDARCCASRITSVTFDIAADPPVVRAQSASTSSTGAMHGGDQPSDSSAPAGLAGTSWQLVRFESGDGTSVTPDDGSKYTLDFQADGRVAARIDCNRGRGTWKSDGSRLELGPLALTRAMCLPPSLHDQIVSHWQHVASYVVRDGHLFLSLKADGGIYEFEPARKHQC